MPKIAHILHQEQKRPILHCSARHNPARALSAARDNVTPEPKNGSATPHSRWMKRLPGSAANSSSAAHIANRPVMPASSFIAGRHRVKLLTLHTAEAIEVWKSGADGHKRNSSRDVLIRRRQISDFYLFAGVHWVSGLSGFHKDWKEF